MRALRRNQLVFWYSPCEGEADVFDEQGRRTGEKRIKRGQPIKCRGCVTASGGTGTAGFNKTMYEPFGEAKRWDYIISLDHPDFEVGEAGVVWMNPTHYREVPPQPVIDENYAFDIPWQFEAKRISFSEHTVTLAVRSVMVSV